MFRGVLFLAAFVLAGAAAAQPTNELNESAKAMIGAWEFSDAARSKVCSVTFSDAAVKVGYKLTFDSACAVLFPVVSNVAGWRYPQDDLLYLLDADGKALVEFSEVEDGIFEAPTPGVGVLFLHNPATAEPDTPDSNGQPGGLDNPLGNQPATPPETPAPQQAPAPKDDGG
jgi:Protease inhibitor Inh